MTSTSLTAEIDQLLNQLYPPDAPGAAAIIVKNGETLLKKGYGLANLEHNIPVTPETVFRIGSVTKQFTAVAILMLAEEGKLALDDPIEKFLPAYPTHGHTITIEHLLTHTSGIKSMTSLPELWEDTGKDFKTDQLIEKFKFKPMDFAPGTRFLYNNSGYFLLGAVIEKISGKSYEAFLQERIFDPLEMKQTYGYTAQRLIPQRAGGYDKNEQGFQNCPYLSMTIPGGAGVMMSTVGDLALWDASLYTEKLLPAAAFQKAWTPFLLKDGSSTHYGYGWGIEQLQGQPLIRHGGGIHGFVCDVMRLPQERLFVSLLSNNTGAEKTTEETAFRMVLLTLGKPVPEPQPIELPAEVLEQLAGVYHNKYGEETHIEVKDGKLIHKVPAYQFEEPIFPLSPEECFPKANVFYHLRFLRGESGKVNALEAVNPYGRVQETMQKIEKESST